MADWGSDSDANEKAENYHEKKRQDVFRRKPFRQQAGEWSDEPRERFHRFQQQQSCEVNGKDNE